MLIVLLYVPFTFWQTQFTLSSVGHTFSFKYFGISSRWVHTHEERTGTRLWYHTDLCVTLGIIIQHSPDMLLEGLVCSLVFLSCRCSLPRQCWSHFSQRRIGNLTTQEMKLFNFPAKLDQVQIFFLLASASQYFKVQLGIYELIDEQILILRQLHGAEV